MEDKTKPGPLKDIYEKEAEDKQALQIMLEKKIAELAHIQTFDEFPVEPERRKALPLNKLRSRLPTAIIFAFHGRKKPVIKMLLTISKSSRAFIIT